MKILRIIACLLVVWVPAFAIIHKPVHKKRHHRTVIQKIAHAVTQPFQGLVTMLKGSLERQKQQNEWADQLGLSPILTDEELKKAIDCEEVVPFPENEDIQIDYNLVKSERRYIRICAVPSILAMAHDYHLHFGKPQRVTDIGRLLSDQELLTSKRLAVVKRRGRKKTLWVPYNSAAAAATGETASLHERFISVDYGKAKLTTDENDWYQKWLVDHQLLGEIDAIIEKRCYHVNFCWNKPLPATTSTAVSSEPR